jgi:Gpi18-like mannosyltransferase
MTSGWLMVMIGCCGLFLLGCRAVFKRTSCGGTGEGRERKLLVLVMAAAFVVRIALAATSTGHSADIGTFSAWAGHAAEGLTSFYSPGYFADYPPGYMYVLWLVGKVRLLLSLDFNTPPFLVILKLPAMLADMVTILIIDRLARRHLHGSTSVALAALFAFNPAVLLDSAVWGQVDSVLTMFILGGVLLLERHPVLSGASFTAALLIKPQALIFAPLPLLWFAVRFLRREQHTSADLLEFSGAAIVTFCAIILPFSVNESPGWIVAKYGGTLASYPYATFNAFNLFALTGANLASTTERWLFFPYGVWGNIFIVLIVLFATVVAVRGDTYSRFWYLSLFLPASVFVLSAKMHERYLFPALVLTLACYIVTREGWALLLYAGFSVTLCLNVAEVLALSYREIYAVPRLDPLLLAVSLVNVLLLLILVTAGYRRYLHSGTGGRSDQQRCRLQQS